MHRGMIMYDIKGGRGFRITKKFIILYRYRPIAAMLHFVEVYETALNHTQQTKI